MIAKSTIIKEVNVDYDKLFDLAEKEFLKEHYYTTTENPSFRFAINWLKKRDWSELKFPEDVDGTCQLGIESMYRNICAECPKREAREDDEMICKHFETCGAGELLDHFVLFLEENGNSLKQRCVHD